jgi:hypothetical protein
MLVRRSVLLALAGVLAAAGCRNVDQRDPVPVLVLATFNSQTGTIPVPNDLALQGAPAQPLGETRDALFGLIGLGGWPPPTSMWSPAPAVAIPLRTETYAPGTGYTPGDPPELDLSTVDEDTIAIVRLNDPPTVVALGTPQYAGGTLLVVPEGGVFAPGRYVVAVRGGVNGVQTTVGGEVVPLQPDSAIALVLANRDLSQPENRPPRPAEVPAEVFDDQMIRLEGVRRSLATGVDFNAVVESEQIPDPEAFCRNALRLPAGTPIPEDTCWLPSPSAGFAAAFDAVDLVFPHEELASIQTFEVFTPSALQEEVTP